MPPQSQAPSSTDENGPLWIAGFIIVSVLIIWFTLHDWLIFLFLKLKLAELYLIAPFTHKFDSFILSLKNFNLIDAKNMSLNATNFIATRVGEVLRYPFMLILVGLAALLYFGNVSVRYRNMYSMNSLAEYEKTDWPQISPVLKLDLVNTPLEKGPWASALNPKQFAEKYNLLIIEKELSGQGELSTAVKLKVTVKKFEAKQVFLMQLGNYWHGVEKIPVHFRALFAMFAAKAHGDQDAVTRLNNQIAITAAKGSPDFTGTDALLAKYGSNKNVQAVTSRYAFVYTVMIGMLELSRTDGVYASSDFLWLKPLDRRLWYTLNNVGRKTAFCEVAGIYSHYYSECKYGRPIFVPMVDNAVEALQIAIDQILFKPQDNDI